MHIQLKLISIVDELAKSKVRNCHLKEILYFVTIIKCNLESTTHEYSVAKGRFQRQSYFAVSCREAV